MTKGFRHTRDAGRCYETKTARGESNVGELEGEERSNVKKKDSQKYPPSSVCEVESDNCNTFVLGVQPQKTAFNNVLGE